MHQYSISRLPRSFQRFASFTISGLIPVFSIFFLLFYSTFIVLYDFVHNFYPSVAPERIISYYRYQLTREGIETPFMLAGSILYLLLVYLAIRWANRLANVFRYPWSILFCIPTLSILLSTRSTMIVPIRSPLGTIVAVFAATSVVGLGYWGANSHTMRRYSMSTFFGLWLLFGCFLLCSLSKPSITDYGFCIGPVLKLMQGETLGTFYMQYSLLGTALFGAMIKLRLRLLGMQLTLAVLFILWFILYFVLISAFIRDRFLRFSFMVSLIIFRLLANLADPISIPAVQPWRLDLWVPLFLIFTRFGVLSPITMLSFAVTYVLDNTFGLFYLGVYLLFCLAALSDLLMASGVKRLPFVFLATGAAVLSSAAAFQLYTFRSFTSPAVSFYQESQVSFMPIARHSAFWIILALLPYVLYLLEHEADAARRRDYLFLFAIAAVELIYFYGRSHENNLLNISGIFVVLMFLSINQLGTRYQLASSAALVVTAFVIASVWAFGGRIQDRVATLVSHVTVGPLFEAPELDKRVDINCGIFASLYPSGQKIVLLSALDSYYNYRCGLPQVGFVVPFGAHVYVDELRSFLVDASNRGYKSVVFESDPTEAIAEIVARDRGSDTAGELVMMRRDGVYEVDYVKRGEVPAVR